MYPYCTRIHPIAIWRGFFSSFFLAHKMFQNGRKIAANMQELLLLKFLDEPERLEAERKEHLRTQQEIAERIKSIPKPKKPKRRKAPRPPPVEEPEPIEEPPPAKPEPEPEPEPEEPPPEPEPEVEQEPEVPEDPFPPPPPRGVEVGVGGARSVTEMAKLYDTIFHLAEGDYISVDEEARIYKLIAQFNPDVYAAFDSYKQHKDAASLASELSKL